MALTISQLARNRPSPSRAEDYAATRRTSQGGITLSLLRRQRDGCSTSASAARGRCDKFIVRSRPRPPSPDQRNRTSYKRVSHPDPWPRRASPGAARAGPQSDAADVIHARKGAARGDFAKLAVPIRAASRHRGGRAMGWPQGTVERRTFLSGRDFPPPHRPQAGRGWARAFLLRTPKRIPNSIR